jgi:RNA polymerase sigma-70 factor (ECF subfamily)
VGRSETPRAERARRFTELVAAHADIVNRYLHNRHRVGDSLEAENLLAEVLAIAWKRFEDVPSDAEAAWLIGVARNRLMNMRSKQARRARLTSTIRPPSAAAPAEDEAMARTMLADAIQSLPEAEREAFTLSIWEGLSPRELGIAMGVTKNAAAIRLSRAKSLLLSRLVNDNAETDRSLTRDTQ